LFEDQGGDMLRFYVEVACTAYRRQLIYRWANLAGLFTNCFFCVILSSVMIALYHARPVTAGYSLRDALSYIWATQALIMSVLPFNWIDLMLAIRSGEVVADLSKPCDFFLYWFSRELGRSVYYVLFRALPIYGVGWLLCGLEVGANWSIWPAFLGCLVLGIMAGVVFRVFLNLMAFWIIEARAVITLGTTLAQFLSGAYIPVVFFPAWLSSLATWLPFNGMMNVPAQIFLGKLTRQTLLFELALQLGWLLVSITVVRHITSLATRRVVVQGG
jgi:ABC-2 type transport system permease protein